MEPAPSESSKAALAVSSLCSPSLKTRLAPKSMEVAAPKAAPANDSALAPSWVTRAEWACSKVASIRRDSAGPAATTTSASTATVPVGLDNTGAWRRTTSPGRAGSGPGRIWDMVPVARWTSLTTALPSCLSISDTRPCILYCKRCARLEIRCSRPSRIRSTRCCCRASESVTRWCIASRTASVPAWPRLWCCSIAAKSRCSAARQCRSRPWREASTSDNRAPKRPAVCAHSRSAWVCSSSCLSCCTSIARRVASVAAARCTALSHAKRRCCHVSDVALSACSLSKRSCMRSMSGIIFATCSANDSDRSRCFATRRSRASQRCATTSYRTRCWAASAARSSSQPRCASSMRAVAFCSNARVASRNWRPQSSPATRLSTRPCCAMT